MHRYTLFSFILDRFMPRITRFLSRKLRSQATILCLKSSLNILSPVDSWFLYNSIQCKKGFKNCTRPRYQLYMTSVQIIEKYWGKIILVNVSVIEKFSWSLWIMDDLYDDFRGYQGIGPCIWLFEVANQCWLDDNLCLIVRKKKCFLKDSSTELNVKNVLTLLVDRMHIN